MNVFGIVIFWFTVISALINLYVAYTSTSIWDFLIHLALIITGILSFGHETYWHTWIVLMFWYQCTLAFIFFIAFSLYRPGTPRTQCFVNFIVRLVFAIWGLIVIF